MSTTSTNSLPARIGKYIFIGLLAYMPLHILVSTLVGTSLHILLIMKVAKDVVLCLGFVAVVVASVRQPFFKALLRDKLAWLIIAFALLNVLLVAVKPTDPDAEVLGLVYNLRFLLFFLYGLLLSHLFGKELVRTALMTVLASGLIVVLFGAVQYLVLPNDSLASVGYNRANGVLPAFFIDDKPDLERIMSTLRDPNSLGSYLIIIISLLVCALLFAARNRDKRTFLSGYLILAVLCLVWTYSRSAWLGTLLAAGVLTVLWLRLSVGARELAKRHKAKLFTVAAAILIVLAAGLYVTRDSYFVKNIVFHADESTVLEDPNELRARFWRESLADIKTEPLGSGPGTAGLASIRNEVQGTTLNENYYLQTAQETGIVGFGLFMAIIIITARRLLMLATAGAFVAIALLASFMGLALTNFLVHIWANEAVAYTWWGLASLAIGAGPAAKKHKMR